MPEITIKYKNKKTVDKISNIKGVTIIPADKSIDFSDLENIFTCKNIIAQDIRKTAWQEKKVIYDF